MKLRKLIFSAAFALLAGTLTAQDVKQLQETARSFQQQGDYDNAILVLKRALQVEPKNNEVKRDLALTYYLQHDNDKAAETIKPLLEDASADEPTFQMAGLIYRSAQNLKEADKVYKNGLKKFPASGPLYSEYGELVETKNPGSGESIKIWEKGIELDPQFSGNYFNASRYYANFNNPLWSLLYGEIFINLESFTRRTIEIKNVLLDGYKKLFANDLANLKGRTEFENQVIATWKKQNSQANFGISPETLTAIRTRFILDWYETNADRFAFNLFEQQRNMLREGLFDAYNQWIFGSVSNASIFQSWTSTHADEYGEFNKYQRNRVFKVAANQYYNK